MSDLNGLTALLRARATNTWALRVDAEAMTAAADAIDALTARVAQLEACLTDTLQQLKAGGVTE